MGQIIGRSAKPDACNIRSLSSFGTPAAGQHILVSTDNSAMQNGQGNFDAYVVGDGRSAATALPLHYFADKEPTEGSKNPVTSCSVYKALYGLEEENINPADVSSTPCFINADAWIVNNTNYYGYYIPVSAGRTIKVTANANNTSYVALFKELPVSGASVAYATGESRRSITAGSSLTLVVPDDALYLWFTVKSGANSNIPSSILVEGVTGFEQRIDAAEDNISNINIAIEGETINIDTSAALSTPCYINNDSWLVNNTNQYGYYVSVQAHAGKEITIKANDGDSAFVAFFNVMPSSGAQVVYANGESRRTLEAGTSLRMNVPNDAVYLWFAVKSYTHDYAPESIVIQGVLGINKEIEELAAVVEEIDDTTIPEINKLQSAIYSDVYNWVLLSSVTLTEGGFINKDNGGVASNSSYNYSNNYIDISGAKKIKTTAGGTSGSAGYAFYDSGKIYISGDIETTNMEISVPSNAKYFRFSSRAYTQVDVFVDSPNRNVFFSNIQGKTIVAFGDSLTELIDDNRKGYCAYMEELTKATIINVGIGASYYRERTTPELNPTSTPAARASLDVVNMVKASMDGDFTYQVNAAEYLKNNESDDNTAIITRLSNIDWDEVDIVTFFAGTNDWNNSVLFGESGSTDPRTTIGAINTIISEILSNYPSIKIYFFTPIIRWIDYSGGTGLAENFSDVLQRGGMTLRQFSAFIANEVYLNHIPVYDAYNLLGWNKYNFGNYFNANDGTHPFKGFYYLAEKFAMFVNSN